MRHLLVCLLAVLAFAAGSPALAAYPPRPEGPVLDQAGIIPAAEEAALDARLREYNQRTGRAVLVATVSSLDGEDIATYGTTLGQNWGAGGKDSDQGLILLIAPKERKLRIEVGYGLEAYLPDVLAGRIIRDTIAPRFKAGDMVGGINAGINAVTAQLDRDPAEAKAIAEAAAAAEAQAPRGQDVSAGSVIFWIVLIVFFMSMFGNRRRGVRRSGIDPGIVLWGISEIAHHAARGSGGSGFGSGDFDGGGGFGGFGGGGFGGGGASGDW